MKKPIIIIGVGEMGGVFARAFLRNNYPVIPVSRASNVPELVTTFPDPALVLLAVAEKDLHPTLDTLPTAWRTNLCLLQNELLPRDWQSHGLIAPTVISVWFEKKKGQDYKVIVPSPVYGPQAGIFIESLACLDIACTQLNDEAQLLFELIRKNVYILTANIAGLITGGTVGTLWQQHQDLARNVASEVIEIQNWLTHQTSDSEALIAAMLVAFEGDLNHGCTGRSAPARLINAIKIADEANLDIPKLREIQIQTQENAAQ